MENCLVKELLADVNNPDLEYFDALQFKVLWPLKTGFTSILIANNNLGVYFGGIGAKLKVLSNGHITQNGVSVGTELLLASGIGEIYIVPDNAENNTEFLLIGLSKITRLWMDNTPIELRNPSKLSQTNPLVLQWNSSYPTLCFFHAYEENSPCNYDFIDALVPDKTVITQFNMFKQYTDNVITLNTYIMKKFTSILNLSFSGWWFTFVGDIANLSGFVNTTSLSLRQNGAYGNIAALGSMKSITGLNMSGSSVSGSIEDFVEALYQDSSFGADDGKKSASGASRILIYFGASTNITLNGAVQRNSGYLAWDDGGSAPTNIRIEQS